jgi:hypothetical protein
MYRKFVFKVIVKSLSVVIPNFYLLQMCQECNLKLSGFNYFFYFCFKMLRWNVTILYFFSFNIDIHTPNSPRSLSLSFAEMPPRSAGI